MSAPRGNGIAALRLALLALAPALASCASHATDGRSSGDGDGSRLVFVLEVDRTFTREHVWHLQDATDEEVVTVAMNGVRRRLDAMSRSVELRRLPAAGRFEASIPASDPLDRELLTGMLRSMWLCELVFVADEASASAHGIDLARERARFDAWRSANPGRPIELFNARLPEADGPARGLAWITAASGLERSDVGWPVLLPQRPADHLGATSFARVWPAVDAKGEPALGFEVRATRTEDLARISRDHAGARLAVVLQARLISAPVVTSELAATGILEGRFRADEVERYARTIQELRSPITVVSAGTR